MLLPAMRHRFWTAAAATALLLVGCDKGPDRSTPEGTIAAARWAVERGEARRIGDYIFADNEETRRLFRRLGVFLGNVQQLGQTIQEKFPAEVAALKAAAEQAAAEGKTTSLVSQLTSQMRPGRGRRSGPPAMAGDDSARQAFDNALKGLFADPYGWVRESEKRLTTTFLTDTSVALLWDEKPILPPIGMVMRRDDKDGRWYFALPTNLPGVSNFMPKTKEQFEIFGGLIKVFDQVVVDLRNDIDEGRLTTLDEVSRAAGEKTFLPAALTVFAYARLTESQKKEAAAK
ncbi:MAG: hypothetical protein RL689_2727 [Planctomycetota bacterium]